MAAPTAPNPDVVAETYRLTQPEPIGEGLSLAQVAVRMGVSKATAGRYVQLAVAHLPLVDLAKRAKAQGDMAQRLQAMLFAVYEEASERRPSGGDEDDEDEKAFDQWLNLLKFAADLEGRLAGLLGLNSATKLQITTNGNGKTDESVRDMGLVKALAAITDRDERDDRALRAGQPGVIELGTEGEDSDDQSA